MTEINPVLARASIAPWLSVSDGARAVEHYRAAFGAGLVYSVMDDDGRVMIARMEIAQAELWLQEDRDAKPPAGDGATRMILTVEDPDAVFERALAAGATEVSPVSEDHGWRIGRLVDPFGHHWEVGKPLVDAG